MRILETERLILRQWRVTDAGALYDYAKNPNVGPHAGWKPHKDINESLEIIEKLFLPYDVFAIVYKETGKIIGSIGLEPDIRRPDIKSREMGYSLSEEYWKKGIMTEAAHEVMNYAFDVLDLDILAICTGPANLRSQRVIEKCGFTYEGTLRQAYRIYDGTLRDILCHSILRSEWYSNRSI